MMTKLDRLPTNKEAVKVWDLSLLSPAEQDRADELMAFIGRADDIDTQTLEPILIEFRDLVEGLPMLADDDPEGGPLIEVPHDLKNYWIWSQKSSEWRHYSFNALGKVQTLRFIELCRAYGYEDNEACLPLGSRTLQVTEQIVPLAEWKVPDRIEMTNLLDTAAKPNCRSPQ